MIELRDVVDDDLTAFFEHQSDPEANRVAVFPPRAYAAFMIHWRTNVLPRREATKKTIVVDGAIAGNVVSWEKDGERAIGYWLGRAFWGRGIASAAVARFVAEHELTRPLYAYVAISNTASVRVLERCGFRRVVSSLSSNDDVPEVVLVLDRM